jgi:hypothetical protein
MCSVEPGQVQPPGDRPPRRAFGAPRLQRVTDDLLQRHRPALRPRGGEGFLAQGGAESGDPAIVFGALGWRQGRRWLRAAPPPSRRDGRPARAVPARRPTPVQAQANPQRNIRWPGLCRQRPLEGTGGDQGVDSASEDGEEAIAFAPAFDHDAPVLLDRLGEQRIMAGERLAHGLRVLLPQAGAALDVGEQKGDRLVL